ncbi:MAG: hypothetical protein JSV09_06695 [Thermoplasmata archaeon]|nr:MAG: hypothetical protein JSV09_06695 [Thermoplasmata archaeon]
MVGMAEVDTVVVGEGSMVVEVAADKAVALRYTQYLGLNLLAQNHLSCDSYYQI